MKEIYIGENNSLSIERLFDNCTISLKYGYNQRKEVEGNDILYFFKSVKKQVTFHLVYQYILLIFAIDI